MIRSTFLCLRLVTGLALLFTVAPLHAAEVTFQNGLNGYRGAESTTLNGEGQKRTQSSYGGAEILGVAGVKHGGFKQLGLVRFNGITGTGENQIPKGASIATARLELYKIDEPENDLYEKTPRPHREIRAFKMLTDWKAGTANGEPEKGSSCFIYRFYDSESPGYWGEANVLEEGPVRNVDFQFNPRAAAPLVPRSGPIWMAWNITEFVQEWVNQPESNHGVYLNALSYYIGAFFASCHHDDPNLRPRLIVEYQ